MKFPFLLNRLGVAAVLLWPTLAQAQNARLCQSPDCLLVENLHSANGLVKSIGVFDTRLHLYIFVPRETHEFKLGVFDQLDDNANAKASQFDLYAPDGILRQTLDAPKHGDWSEYPVQTGGKWGVWRLSVRGPEDVEAVKGQKTEGALNAFMVRTLGDVDLYLKPEPVARVRGIRLAEPHFGGAKVHQFTLQPLDNNRLRFAVLRDTTIGASHLEIRASMQGVKEDRSALEHDDRLHAGTTLETVQYTATQPLKDLIPVTVSDVQGVYGLGIEQESRLFFNATPLQKLTRVALCTTDEDGRGIAARLQITSPQTANENSPIFTDANGNGATFALPGVDYSVIATRGFEFEAGKTTFDSASKTVTLALKRRWLTLAGWCSGDDHCHTLYYDGTNTPRQMVEAARGAGLDWLVVSEHAHSPQMERTQRANTEALAAADTSLTVIPGMEFTGPQFHANIIGALVPIHEGASIAEIVAAVQAVDTPQNPIVTKLNHPTLGHSAAEVAREAAQIPMLELWNSEEPGGTQLWWELLNRGEHVWADTASDSHNRQNLEVGSRRTYVYLGAEPRSAATIVRALREGHSFLSRGAVLDFTLNGHRPGATIAAQSDKSLQIHVEAHSSRPIESIEVISGGVLVHRFGGAGKTDFEGEITLPAKAGWYLTRVVERDAKNDGDAPIAMTNPIWVESKN